MDPQIGDPSMLTTTAGLVLKKMAGGFDPRSALFFGTISLVSMLASTRSSDITTSPDGMAWLTAEITSCEDALSSDGKFALVILIPEKFTSRSATATLVCASTRTVPNCGLVAPTGVYATAAYAVSIC